MELRKRMILKPLILGSIGLIVLGYSIYRQKTDPDPVPEIETVKRLIRDSAPHSGEDYTSAWIRAEASLMTRKKYDDVHRLNRIVRESGKLPNERLLLLDFSEYTAYFHSGNYEKAMNSLDLISARPSLAPEVKSAIEGERMRVLAASGKMEKAMELFRSFRRNHPDLPESSLPLCRTAVRILLQYGKKEEAYALLTDCAASVPEGRRHHFLEPLGVLLVRLEKEPEKKRDSLVPRTDVPGFFMVSMSMAEEYGKRKRPAEAEVLLRSLAGNEKLPSKFRGMASLKLNIMKEKQEK